MVPQVTVDRSGCRDRGGWARGKQFAGKNGYPCVSDAAIAEMKAADFDQAFHPHGYGRIGGETQFRCGSVVRGLCS